MAIMPILPTFCISKKLACFRKKRVGLLFEDKGLEEDFAAECLLNRIAESLGERVQFSLKCLDPMLRESHH